MIGPRPDAAPTIVMLHEGLGSVTTWGEFPREARRAHRRRRVRLFARRLRQVVHHHAAASARLHAARGDRGAAETARRDRIPARHPARPQRRRDHRGVLRRQRAGSSRARADPDGAALLHGGEQHRGDPKTVATYETTDLRAKLARHQPMSTRRSAAGAAPGSIRDLRISIPPTRSPTSACRCWCVQGAADPYGTLAQVRVRRGGMLLPGRDAGAATASAMRRIGRSRRRRSA